MPIIVIFALLLLIFRHNIKRASKIDEHATDAYWEQERLASFARKKDLSELTLLNTSPVKDFLVVESDDNLRHLQSNVEQQLSLPMVNLSHLSNTELKLQYGIANFPLISEYDQNYATFSHNLYLWGQALYEQNRSEDARKVLEYTLHTGTDISGVFLTLARIYSDCGEIRLVTELVACTDQLNPLLQKKVVAQLKKIINSY